MSCQGNEVLLTKDLLLDYGTIFDFVLFITCLL